MIAFDKFEGQRRGLSEFVIQAGFSEVRLMSAGDKAAARNFCAPQKHTAPRYTAPAWMRLPPGRHPCIKARRSSG
jgi:hypothetical protein